jgi:hypothetical protein
MTRYIPAVLAAATLLALTAPTHAQTERNQKLLGTWTRHSDGCKVKLDIKPEVLRCTVTIAEGYAITVEADYVVSKDGVLLGIVRGPKTPKAAKKDDDDDPLSKRLFYLQLSADEKSLLVSNLNYGDNGDDKTKEVLEGKYHRTESKHPTTRPSAQYLQHPPDYCAPATDPSPARTKKKRSALNPDCRTSEVLPPCPELPQIEPGQLPVTPERVHGGIQ